MKVLITGATGFIGAHCLKLLLEQGHTVVAAVRSHSKGSKVLQPYADHVTNGKASFVVVEDITAEGTFDRAVQSNPPFDVVLHAASPFHFKSKNFEEEILNPAVKGTTGILKSIYAHAPSVKRVVITSSMAAVLDYASPPSIYKEDTWNPITWEQACSDPVSAYMGSKTFAERSAWDFVAEKKPNFTLAAINPPAVFGAPLFGFESWEAVNTSNTKFADLVRGEWKAGLPPTPNGHWVDVEDVAKAHIRALEVDEAAGRRFLLVAGNALNGEIATIASSEFPDLREKLPQEPYGNEAASPAVDTEPARSVLGTRFVELALSVKQTISALSPLVDRA